MNGKELWEKVISAIKDFRWKRQYSALAVKIALISFASLVLLVLLLVLSVYLGVFGKLPDIKELKRIKSYTASEVYSSDNYLLGRYYVENRTNTSLEEIPDYFLEALIATEDVRFYDHRGVDLRSSMRVLFKSILLHQNAGGGSTITQQLAKNLYPREQRRMLSMPISKLKEIFTARRLEKVYSKNEILELYLNTVPFGDNTYGVETASLIFFSKMPTELKVEEAAVLVGLLKANTQYHPVLHYEASLKRRNVILDQMVKYDYLDRRVADSLKKLPIMLEYRRFQHDEGLAPYLRAYVNEEVQRWAAENPREDGSNYNLYTDGLKIYTTVDYKLQLAAETAVKNHMSVLQSEFVQQWNGREPWKKNTMLAIREIRQCKRYKNLQTKGYTEKAILEELSKPVKGYIFTWKGNKEVTISPLDSILYHFGILHAGLLSMESHSGFIKAWVGGIDYKFFQYDHVTSRRQPGSTFKPFVYAAGIEQGMAPCDFFANDSVVYEAYDNWTPRNAERTYGGYYSMKGALAHSVNTVSTTILMQAGIDNVISLARSAGFSGDLPAVPSLALGTGTASLYELVQAYSIFLNGGKRVRPIVIRRIEDANGKLLFAQGPSIGHEPVISDSTAELTLAMLTQVVDSGTASSLRGTYQFSGDLAGKTGTTQNQTDGWFIGLTPDLITGVWVGGDNPVVRFKSIRFGQGAHMALPVFAGYMNAVYKHPVFKSSRYSAFNISPEAMQALECAEFTERKEETLRDILDETKQSVDKFLEKFIPPRRKRLRQLLNMRP
ncbi:MAG: transglycosylase domain-containing protein [Bacteroidales bacterium]|nr:transglycosylase domain-containing protein [Bacteroidales bacterium]